MRTIKVISILLVIFISGYLIIYISYSLPRWLFNCPLEDIVLFRPKGSGETFTVLVARLENDPQEEQTRLLRNVFWGITGVESVDTCKRLRVHEGLQSEVQGRKWLQKHNADLLIYGQLTEDSVRIFFLNKEGQQPWGQPLYLLKDHIEVPYSLLPRFSEHVVVFALTPGILFTTPKSTALLEVLRPWTTESESLPQDSDKILSYAERSQGEREMMRGILASLIGTRMGNREMLEVARGAYENALQAYQQTDRGDWAMTQNNLGIVLLALSESTGNIDLLDQAVAAYRLASQEYFQQKDIHAWSIAQLNLALTLTRLGEYHARIEPIQETITIYRSLLNSFNRHQSPLKWATILHHLSNVLRVRGDLDETHRLRWFEEAVTTSRSALEERTYKDDPLQWAETQNILANALTKLGEYSPHQGILYLEEAVIAYKAALEEYTAAHRTLEAAEIQMNLGDALIVLSDRTNLLPYLQQAGIAYRTASRQYVDIPLSLAQIRTRLAGVLRREAALEKDRNLLEQASLLIEQALTVLTDSGNAPQIQKALQEKQHIQNLFTLLPENENTSP